MVETPQNYTGDLLTLDGIFNNEISIFKGYNGNKVIKNITIKQLLAEVKDGLYKDQILKLRTLTDKLNNTIDGEAINKINLERKFIKSNINAVALSCKCKSRNKDIAIADKLISHSGLIQIDIDKLDAQKFAATNKLIQNDKHTLFSFVSPSGNGYKIGVQIDSNYHRESFEMLEKYYKDTYDIDIDKQTIDLFRLLTYSFDSELFINPNATKFDFDIADYNKSNPQLVEQRNNAISNDIQRDYFNNNKILDKSYLNALKTCKDWLNKSVKGLDRSNTRLRVGILLGRYIGGELVSEIDAINDIRNEVERNTDDIKKAFKDVYNGIEYGKQIPFKNLPFCYWHEIEINKTPQLKIDVKQLYDFLANNGFGLIKVKGKDSPILCRTLDKRISETNTNDLKNFVLNQLDYLPEQVSKNFNKDQLHKLLINGASVYFHKDKYSIVFKIINFTPFKDSETTSYYFFNNCYVEVTDCYILRKDYKDFDGLIWDSQIINHNFSILNNYDDYRDFDYSRFITNLCTNKDTGEVETKRLDALTCCIGYLMHTFRPPSNAKAVILSEISNNGRTHKHSEANGGTGKGLIIQGIGKLRKLTRIEGKKFSDNDNRFALQNVTLDTQVIYIDDIEPNFLFRRLYSQITEGIEFEKKGKDPIHIPYNESPKIVIPTNYVIKGNGESDKRRQYEMKLFSYYNSKERPIDDFKRHFFIDWCEADYNKFYNFMLWCVKNYLKKVNINNGYELPDYESKNLPILKIIELTSEKFYDYASLLEINKEYVYADIYDNYINETGENITRLKFTKFLQIYAEYNKLTLINKQQRIKNDVVTIIMFKPI